MAIEVDGFSPIFLDESDQVYENPRDSGVIYFAPVKYVISIDRIFDYINGKTVPLFASEKVFEGDKPESLEDALIVLREKNADAFNSFFVKDAEIKDATKQFLEKAGFPDEEIQYVKVYHGSVDPSKHRQNMGDLDSYLAMLFRLGGNQYQFTIFHNGVTLLDEERFRMHLDDGTRDSDVFKTSSTNAYSKGMIELLYPELESEIAILPDRTNMELEKAGMKVVEHHIKLGALKERIRRLRP